jgi:GNAT superfamily N-acetyltransferase
MTVEVHPATPDRFDAAATVLRPKSDVAGACWCLSYRLSSGDNNTLSGDDRAAYLRELTGRRPAPGMVGYLDGQPVGWCGVGPRADVARLRRSRTIPHVDDRPVWSVFCFVVRPGFRRRGITRALLDGAVAYARDNGAATIEGYPVDPEGRRIHQAAAYVGMIGIFDDAGFERVVKTASVTDHSPRWLVRLELS